MKRFHLYGLLHRFGFLAMVIVFAGTLSACGLKRNLKLPPTDNKNAGQSTSASQAPAAPTAPGISLAPLPATQGTQP
jgi:predicted small lipoprotein YifL